MNPKQITRLSSHTYELPTYYISEDGAQGFKSKVIAFCKGSKDNIGHPGFFTETLIELCKIHLESVNQGDLENPYTAQAIEHLRAALWNLDERIKDRQARGVFQTYQK